MDPCDSFRYAVHQLVWTIPVDPTTVNADGNAFSTNSSIAFDDGPPPLVDRDFILFPPNDDYSPPSRKPTHGKKKPEDHIPRPPNAFILFRSSFIKGQHVPTEVETNHSTLSKIIGLTWKNLPNEERLFWHGKAKAALDEHKRKFPLYAFRPTQAKSKGSTERRKVREVGPKDPVRCAKIAELLVEGKKGVELDAAIQEFDKHHVPEIVTRFDKPLTARVYRRSSSAPIPDDERAERRPSQKSRSASTQPSTPIVPSMPFTIKDYAPDETIMASFDQFSFSAQPSPSFVRADCISLVSSIQLLIRIMIRQELNVFSFDNQPTYHAYPTMTESISPYVNNDLLFQAADNFVAHTPSNLSINTTYFDDQWNCPSPISSGTPSTPATPSSYMGSPCPNNYASYTIESLEHSLAKSLRSNLYQNTCDLHFSGTYPGEADSPSAYLPYEEEHCNNNNVHMVNQDLDFTAFMASLPEYSL